MPQRLRKDGTGEKITDSETEGNPHTPGRGQCATRTLWERGEVGIT